MLLHGAGCVLNETDIAHGLHCAAMATLVPPSHLHPPALLPSGQLWLPRATLTACVRAVMVRSTSLLRDAPGGPVSSVKVGGRFECNDGAVLHEWALAGKGLAWRSLWEVGSDLQSGRLIAVLNDFAAPPMGIYALFPQRRHLPLRVRLFVDHLKESFGDPDYWR